MSIDIKAILEKIEGRYDSLIYIGKNYTLDDLKEDLKKMDKDTSDVIISDPEIMCGIPIFNGTRIPVYLIVRLIATGVSEAEIREDYPRLTTEMIQVAKEKYLE